MVAGSACQVSLILTEEACPVLLCVRISVTSQAQLAIIASSYFCYKCKWHSIEIIFTHACSYCVVLHFYCEINVSVLRFSFLKVEQQVCHLHLPLPSLFANCCRCFCFRATFILYRLSYFTGMSSLLDFNLPVFLSKKSRDADNQTNQ